MRLLAVLALLAPSLCACSSPAQISPSSSQEQPDAAADGTPTPDASIDSAPEEKPEALDAGEADSQQGDAAQEPESAPASECSEPPLPGKVALPADDSLHTKEPQEWWYWTGHVKTQDGRWFGFEETFFRATVLGATAHMVNTAVTDIDRNVFYQTAFIGVGDLPSKADGFSFDAAFQTAQGGDGHDLLHAQGAKFSFDLQLDATKRAVLQHEDGYTDYSVGGYTYYYSRERMKAAGTLVVEGVAYPVEGIAWFDHQYGDLSSLVTAGWDWFALQLDDQRELMVFLGRKGGQTFLVGGSLTDASCSTTEIAAEEIEMTALGQWKSPHTGCTYPSGWKLKVQGEEFTVLPLVEDQEMYKAKPVYWEGASSVTGSVAGRAYVELNGYCPASPL